VVADVLQEIQLGLEDSVFFTVETTHCRPWDHERVVVSERDKGSQDLPWSDDISEFLQSSLVRKFFPLI
jgi:ABC-type uncharacterized transport system auxiliary subunit